MVLNVPDDMMQQAGLGEREALVEFSCRLFQAEKVTLWQAARLAGVSRSGMESALIDRQIPVYRITLEDLRTDLETLDRLGV